MRTRTVLNNMCKQAYNKKFNQLNESELKDLAFKLNIPVIEI